MTRRVHQRDDQGRPTDVTFSGDPATQCPGCLSREVEPLRAVGFASAGDTLESDPVPHRRMRCAACGARWWRAGA